MQGEVRTPSPRGKVPLGGVRLPSPSRVLQIPDYHFNIQFQFWNIMLYNRPDRVGIDSEIVMDQDIPHSDNIRPGDVGMARLEIVRKGAACFPDNADMMNHPCLY